MTDDPVQLIVGGDAETVAGWGGVRGQIGYLDRSESLVGGVVFCDWDASNGIFEVRAGGRGSWLRPGAILLMFEWAFSSADVRVLMARMDAPSAGVLRMARRALASVAVVPALAAGGADQTFITLRRDDWRRSALRAELVRRAGVDERAETAKTA